MRIIAGEYGGRRLKTPKNAAIRPTSDKIRGAMFNALAARLDLSGVRVLDGFAGSGALGLEALSRGSEFCVFTDINVSLCRENIAALEVEKRTHIQRGDVTKLSFEEAFDLILFDPPYGEGLGEAALQHLHKNNNIAPGAWVILEEAKSSTIDLPDFVDIDSEKIYGDTKVLICRYTNTPP